VGVILSVVKQSKDCSRSEAVVQDKRMIRDATV